MVHLSRHRGKCFCHFWREILKPTIATLEKKLITIKRKIAEIGDIRPGSLSEQYNVCGNSSCRCKADPPKEHGPYFKITATGNGKSTCRFVKEDELPVIEDQLKNFKQLRTLVDEWIELGTQIADMRLTREPKEK